MTVSVGMSFLIALVAVICLGAFIGIVVWANRTPYFRNGTRPRETGTGVIGGIHRGDPRSVAPHRDEVVEQADTAEHADTAEGAGPGRQPEPAARAASRR